MHRPKSSNQPRPGILLTIILVILNVFINIGDIVRYFFRLIYYIPLQTYNIIISLIRRAVVFFRPKRKTLKRAFVRTKVQKKQSFSGRVTRWVHIGDHITDWLRNSIYVSKTFFSGLNTFFSGLYGKWETHIIAKKQLGLLKHEKERELAKVTIPKPIFIWPKIRFHKKRGRKPKLSKWEQSKSFITGVVVTVVFFYIPISAYQWLKALPNPHLLSRRDLEVTTKIFDRNGTLLYEMYADQNRTPLPLSEIPKSVKDATIAIEDRDFYYHGGVSIRGITRALKEIIFNNHIQGGSTITQQLIKSALLTPEITITRKIKEVVLAFWAERLYTKDQILEMYLNQVPYGGTAWGIEAASQTYFGKSVKDVTLAEAALLAGLPAAPSEYSPFGEHPEEAITRQHEVLKSMLETRVITREEVNQALSEPLAFTQPQTAIRAPHFVMFVRDLLEKRYGARLVEQGGLRITTSLDYTLQEKVQEIVKNSVDALASLRVGNGAAMVTNPKTGEILAMVGSKDYFDIQDQGNVNVTIALRQPGSSIKVVNYSAALENGFTAASVIDDSPIAFAVAGGPTYAPVNYDGKYHGPTPIRYALANSYNIPAVKVLSKIGVGTMLAKGALMGITTWQDTNRYGLSLTLGGGDVTLYDMMQVYGTLANMGQRIDLNPILEVTDYTGHVYEKDDVSEPVQAVKPQVAWILGNILSDNTARSTAFGPNSSLVIPGKTVSVKTGTTDSKRDNWTFGYTPSYVVGVWVGNNDNSPMDPVLTSGITGAAPIWHDIMGELLKNKADETLPKPPDVIGIPCYFGRVEYFIAGTQPANGSCAALPTPTPTPIP